MTTSARLVADEIRSRISGVGTVKVHKLLYYAQGHHLATFGQPLFRETVSAWDMGPVVGTLWYEESNGVQPQVEDAGLTEGELNTIGYVVHRYGGLTGNDLIRLSHTERPWRQANAERPASTSVRIEQEAIRAYFSEVADEDDEMGPRLDAQALKDFLADADPGAASEPGKMEDLAARLADLGR